MDMYLPLFETNQLGSASSRCAAFSVNTTNVHDWNQFLTPL